MEGVADNADVSSSRGKSKAILNRRPSGYWKVFSHWWRGRYATLNSRPTVHEVIEWYNENAESSWPAGDVPSLKAVLRQSKGLRPIDGLKEYFRMYRKKRKEQGGMALTANAEEPGQRRPRVVKRRRPQEESSDEDEVQEAEQEASACSNHCQSDDGDGDKAETVTPGSNSEVEDVPATSAAEALAAGIGFDEGESRSLAAVHAVFEAWNPTGPGSAAAMAAMAGSPPPPPPAGFAAAKRVSVGASKVLPPRCAAHPMPMELASGANHLPALTSTVGMVYHSQPIVVQKTRVCRPPPHASFRPVICPFANLPPLSAAAAAAAAAANATGPMGAPSVLFGSQPLVAGAPSLPAVGSVKPEPYVKQEAQTDDHEGDRCSGDGSCPTGPQNAYNAGGYKYPPSLGAPHYYSSHPHHAAACEDASHPMFYMYDPVSYNNMECGSGAASSDYSPTVPWPPADGGLHHPMHARQGSAESIGQGCLYHPHPYHPAWGSWYPGGVPPGSMWQGPVLRHEGSGLCYSSGDIPRSDYATCADPPSYPVSPQPVVAQQVYGGIGACPGYAGFPPACPDSWGPQRNSVTPLPNTAPEGDACSSGSASEDQPYRNGGPVGRQVLAQRMLGAGPPYSYGVWGATAQGMVAAGSSNSMASLAPAVDDTAFLAMPNDAKANRCRPTLPGDHAPRHGRVMPKASFAVGAGPAAFPLDASAAPGSSESSDGHDTSPVMPQQEMHSGLRNSEVEGVDCGLGLAEGFGGAAREALDVDLAVAWESFVACDVNFDNVLNCPC